MIRRYCLGMFLVACSCVAFAGGRYDVVRQQVEASVLVTGTIQIEPDGSVTGHHLDHPDKLEAGVVNLVDRTLPTWRFDPVLEDGKAHKATAKMSLLIVANKLDPSRFTVRIRSAQFQEVREVVSESVSSKRMTPPRYPAEALSNGVTGTVYLAVRVDRQGEVSDVMAEQVNLKFIASEREMQRWREVLAEPAVKAARHWHFNPPTAGQKMEEEFWSVRVPVAYLLFGDAKSEYGKWELYVPGPRQSAPWLKKAGDDFASSPDALVAGEIYQVGLGLHLLTPLEQG